MRAYLLFSIVLFFFLIFGCTNSEPQQEKQQQKDILEDKTNDTKNNIEEEVKTEKEIKTEINKEIPNPNDTVIKMRLTSSAFSEGEYIPSKYTCDGENDNPQLKIENAPDGTASFALIVDDPDARSFVHWVTWNMAANTKEIPENRFISTQGLNDFRSIGYEGPCPPSGQTHNYRFKLYALDTILDFKSGALTEQIEEAMLGHVVAQTELNGKYQRS